MDWINLAHNRDQCLSYANTAVNLPVPEEGISRIAERMLFSEGLCSGQCRIYWFMEKQMVVCEAEGVKNYCRKSLSRVMLTQVSYAKEQSCNTMIQKLSLAVRVKCFSEKPFGRNIRATVVGGTTFVCENVNLRNSDGNVRIFCGLWCDGCSSPAPLS